MNPSDDRVEFLKQLPLFAHISDQHLKRIAPDATPRQFKPGAIIFHQGDPGRVLYLIKAGQVRIFINGLDGNETSVILIGRPGDIFGELAVIDGLARSATAVAQSQTLLYTFNREHFRQHMKQCPQLALNFMKALSHRVRYNTRQVDSFASLDVPQRLARKLMELAQNYGHVENNEVRIDLTLNQSHLASLIGATRESINKCLADFRRQGWIRMNRGTMTILDPDALRAQVSTGAVEG